VSVGYWCGFGNIADTDQPLGVRAPSALRMARARVHVTERAEAAPGFALWDAELRYAVPGVRVADPKACQCGEVLKGVIKPWECKVFGTACTPETPIGTRMVSSQIAVPHPLGLCAAIRSAPRGQNLRNRLGDAMTPPIPDEIISTIWLSEALTSRRRRGPHRRRDRRAGSARSTTQDRMPMAWFVGGSAP